MEIKSSTSSGRAKDLSPGRGTSTSERCRRGCNAEQNLSSEGAREKLFAFRINWDPKWKKFFLILIMPLIFTNFAAAPSYASAKAHSLKKKTASAAKLKVKYRHAHVTSKKIKRIPLLTPNEAKAISVDAYIYGYPLVTMEMTRRVMTNVKKPEDNKAPMGQIFNFRHFPTPTDKEVTTPNADTLYSSAFLDLSKEPYVFSIPDANNRYYVISILDAWTNVEQSVGKRTTGTKAQQYVLVGPAWHGQIPAPLKKIKLSTNIVWILGRTYCTGTQEDYSEAYKFQDQLSLVPLSLVGKTYIPPKGVKDAKIDMKTPVRDSVNQMDAVTYFNLLAMLMKENPPTVADRKIIAKMARIGVVPGHSFDVNKLGQPIVAALQSAPKIAQEKIIKNAGRFTIFVNGWFYSDRMGLYGIDYLKRAYVTMIGLGANRTQDAMYFISEADSNAKPYDGANNKYRIHFAKNQIPPVNGFWSLTMYGADYFFVPNPINRYVFNSRDKFRYNQDGSLDFYIQKDSPGKDHEANWLPTPNGQFILMLRLYWPKAAVLNGFWLPPAIIH